MRKRNIVLSLLLALSFMTGCSLNHKYTALEQKSYHAAGYDKNADFLQTQSNAAQDPALTIERRLQSVPGVERANVLFYGVDNLIVGLNTTGPSKYSSIERGVRRELQGEAKHWLIYSVHETHPDLLARIEQTRNKIRAGQKVSEAEMLSVVNGVWKAVMPFNFLSKS